MLVNNILQMTSYFVKEFAFYPNSGNRLCILAFTYIIYIQRHHPLWGCAINSLLFKYGTKGVQANSDSFHKLERVGETERPQEAWLPTDVLLVMSGYASASLPPPVVGLKTVG